MKVLIYLEEQKLAPAGGPLAVGFYYHQEIQKNGDKEFDFVKTSNERSVAFTYAKSFSSYLPEWFNNIIRSIRRVKSTKRFLERNKEDDIDYGKCALPEQGMVCF